MKAWSVALLTLALLGAVLTLTQDDLAARVYAKAVPVGKDGPFTLGNTTWPSKAAFIQSGGRCGTPAPTAAQIRQVESALARFDGRNQRSGPGQSNRRAPGSVTVTVYFHVITSASGAGNVSDEQIQAQLDVLNAAYAGEAVPGAPGQGPGETPAANTPFRFVLGGIDRTANNAWFNMQPGSRQERQAKAALRVGGADVLNFYTANVGGDLLGWAYPPLVYAVDPVLDGVVCLFASLPGGFAEPYNLGDTATHEVGHWLGLFHTFEGGCTRGGILASSDGVYDTPAEGEPFFGQAPPYRDSCTGARFPGRDPAENFMDYSDDDTLFQFTPEQSLRMDRMASLYRGL